MQVHFHGAAGEVTGSMHLVEAAGRRILLDCGLIQGSRESEARNEHPFPVDPSTLDAVATNGSAARAKCVEAGGPSRVTSRTTASNSGRRDPSRKVASTTAVTLASMPGPPEMAAADSTDPSSITA